LKTLLLAITFAFIFPIQPANSQERVSIASLNAWMIPILRKRATDRAHMIGKLAREFDGIFLQEVFTKKHKNIIKGEMPNFNSFSDKRSGIKLPSGLLNLTKFKIIETDYFRFNKCQKVQCLAKKGALRTRVLIGDKKVDIYNIHTEPFKKRFNVRKLQFNQLIEEINLNDPQQNIATIIIGDFNVQAGTKEYTSMNKLFESNGFRDSWGVNKGVLGGDTWNSFENDWGQIIDRASLSQSRLDYIFVRDGDSIIDVEDVDIVFNKKVLLAPNDLVKHYLSDHFGVKIDFILK